MDHPKRAPIGISTEDSAMRQEKAESSERFDYRTFIPVLVVPVPSWVENGRGWLPYTVISSHPRGISPTWRETKRDDDDETCTFIMLFRFDSSSEPIAIYHAKHSLLSRVPRQTPRRRKLLERDPIFTLNCFTHPYHSLLAKVHRKHRYEHGHSRTREFAFPSC